jgi:hypothetical protein
MSDDDEKPGAKVVHLFGPPPAVEGAPIIGERYGRCYRHSPELDADTRAVTCGRCKASLDPFDTLMLVAQRHEEWARLSDESRTMRKELEALKAEEQRVRQRTQSHARKDAAEAVAAERAKTERQRFEIGQSVDDARRALDRIDRRIGRLAIVRRPRRKKTR